MTATARSVLLCPECGAPLPPAAAHEAVCCAFCKATSTPEPEGAKRAEASDLVCPRCDARLYAGKTSDVTLLACGLCGGIWLDNPSATRAMKTFDAAVVALSSQAASHTKYQPDRRPPIACVVCKAPAARVTVSQLAIEIDACNEHGTWFDRGELGAILDALRPRPQAAAALQVMDVPLRPDEIPDFRAGQPTDFASAGLVAGGVFTLLGALLGVGSSRD